MPKSLEFRHFIFWHAICYYIMANACYYKILDRIFERYVMKKVDMIVKCPFFYTMEGEGVGFKKDVAMVVDGGKIVEFVGLDVVDKEYQAEEVLDMKNHAIFPGFIDAHMHTFDDILRDGKKIYATMCDDSHKLVDAHHVGVADFVEPGAQLHHAGLHDFFRLHVLDGVEVFRELIFRQVDRRWKSSHLPIMDDSDIDGVGAVLSLCLADSVVDSGGHVWLFFGKHLENIFGANIAFFCFVCHLQTTNILHTKRKSTENQCFILVLPQGVEPWTP